MAIPERSKTVSLTSKDDENSVGRESRCYSVTSVHKQGNDDSEETAGHDEAHRDVLGVVAGSSVGNFRGSQTHHELADMDLNVEGQRREKSNHHSVETVIVSYSE